MSQNDETFHESYMDQFATILKVTGQQHQNRENDKQGRKGYWRWHSTMIIPSEKIGGSLTETQGELTVVAATTATAPGANPIGSTNSNDKLPLLKWVDKRNVSKS